MFGAAGLRRAPCCPTMLEDIGENEAISLYDLAHGDIDRFPEAGTVINEGMELAVLPAWVDAGRQVGEELGVEIAAGEFGGQHLRIDAGDFRAKARGDHGPGQIAGRNLPDGKQRLKAGTR